MSFREFLKWKNIKPDLYSSKSKSLIVNSFEHYITASSLPELYDFSKDIIKSVLHEYLNMVIFKDLIERYQLSNHFLIKYLVKFLLNNTGNLLSINKVYNDFKSLGFKVSKQSIYQYVDYLEDAYIFYQVPVFSNNLREKNRNPHKIYCIDNGLKELVSITNDRGRLFENMVFLELRRRNKDIFYFKKNQEVDFCFYNNVKKPELITVCYSLNDYHTEQREINGLSEAMKSLGIKTSYLINNESEKEIKIEGNSIRVLPLWKWLITNNH